MSLSVGNGGVVNEDIGAVPVTVTLTGNLKTDVIVTVVSWAATGEYVCILLFGVMMLFV